MLLHLYDISQHPLAGNYILYDPATYHCSSFDSPDEFMRSYERVTTMDYSYFTPDEGTLICIFEDDDVTNFWEQHPELLL